MPEYTRVSASGRQDGSPSIVGGAPLGVNSDPPSTPQVKTNLCRAFVGQDGNLAARRRLSKQSLVGKRRKREDEDGGGRAPPSPFLPKRWHVLPPAARRRSAPSGRTIGPPRAGSWACRAGRSESPPHPRRVLGMRRAAAHSASSERHREAKTRRTRGPNPTARAAAGPRQRESGPARGGPRERRWKQRNTGPPISASTAASPRPDQT